METIKKEMLISECVEKHPKSAQVMMENGMHCVGCHVAVGETIEQGAKAHGLSDEQIEKMMKNINELQ